LLAYVVALALARDVPRLFAATALALAVFGFGANFTNSEGNLFLGLAWLAGVLLALPGRRRFARGIILPALAFVLLRVYEGMLLAGPVLAAWAYAKAVRTDDVDEKIGLVLATLAFAVGCLIGFSSYVAPRDPVNAAAFAAALFAYWRNPQMWLLGAMYFCYAYDIGVFLSWFPKYLNAARGLDLKTMGLYASVPFLAGLIGDVTGGVVSDEVLKRTAKLRFARRIVSVFGFWVSAVAVSLAAWVSDPLVSIAWFSLALFALELTVGVSWAVTLDVGGEFAGSISAVMNTLGNIGAAIAVAVTARLATYYGWGSAFAVIAALAVIAGLLMLTVNPERRFYREEVA